MSTALLAVATFFEWETMTTAQLTDRRRSKRVAKAVPILLSGSDIEDKQFSEQTRTLVLSRHGAGIFSTKKLAPQSVLIIRCAETNKEAAVRVIDKVAGTPEGYTYGVAFLDPRIDLWDMEFAPDFQADATTKILECISCQERAPINLNEVELDVYAINKTLSRYCANCGEATKPIPRRPPALQKRSPKPKQRRRFVKKTGARTFGRKSTSARAFANRVRSRSSLAKICREADSASRVRNVTRRSQSLK